MGLADPIGEHRSCFDASQSYLNALASGRLRPPLLLASGKAAFFVLSTRPRRAEPGQKKPADPKWAGRFGLTFLHEGIVIARSAPC